MKRFAIWDKKTPVITPSGEIFQPEEWVAKFPVAGLDHITVICSAGEINGGIFDTLGQMVMRYENDGCDFTGCETPEEKLAAIEAFDDERAAKAHEADMAAQEAEMTKAMNEELTATSLASIAASMEYQNMMTLPDEEV